MRTRRGLKADEPLLVGRLVVLPGSPHQRPTLGIDVWCPFCKRMHQHGWDDAPFPSDAVSHRQGHGVPCWPDGYHVGLDPSHAEHNRQTIEAWRLAVLDWERRQAAAAKLKTSGLVLA